MSKHVARASLVVGTAGAVAKAATEYSESTAFRMTTGSGAAVKVVSSAGSITISQQVSYDNKNWFDPIGSTGSALGGVASGLTVTTGTWIAYDPVMAPYIRFKVVEADSAATVVTLEFMFQEEI